VLEVPLRNYCITIAIFNDKIAFVSEVDKTALVEAENTVHLQVY